MANPIKYSDLVVPDKSIEELIAQLKELKQTYAEMQAEIVGKAKDLKNALSDVSGATEQGRNTTSESAKKADELASAMQRLSKAQNENAETIALFNTKLKEQTQLNALNARALLSEDGSYNQLAATLAKLKLQYQQLGEAQRNSEKGDKLRSDIAQTSAAIRQYNEEIKEEIKLAEVRAKIRNAEKGSYNQLSAIYTGLKLKINAMGEADEKAVVAKRKLEEQAKAVYQQMIKLQEATGKHTLSVGNYAKSWDGLRFSVFQVMREIPNAAMNLNTFFLAISNNLPIVADEIARVNAENKKLAAEGKPTTSVIKQIASAVFSWQTLMVTGIFLLTKFGAQIVDWIGSLFKGEKAAYSYANAVSDVNKALQENTGEYGRNITEYKRLQAEWKNISSLKEKEKWLKANATAVEGLTNKVHDLNDADTFFVKNTANVIEALKLRAKAKAAEAEAQKKYSEAFQKELEADARGLVSQFRNTYKASFEALGLKAPEPTYGEIQQGLGVDWYNTGFGQGLWEILKYPPRLLDAIFTKRTGMLNASEGQALYEAEQAARQGDMLMEYMLDLNAMWRETLGIKEPKSGKGGRTGNGRDPRDITKDIEKVIRDVQQALSESYTALMGSGINHTIEQIEDATQKGINKMEDIRGRIQHWLDDPKRFKLTDKQRESLEALKGLIDLTQGNIRAKGAYYDDKGNLIEGIDARNARIDEEARVASLNARLAKLNGESTMGLGISASFAQRRAILAAEQEAEIKNLNQTYKLRADLIEQGDKDELRRLEEYSRERAAIARRWRLQEAQLAVGEINANYQHYRKMNELAWRTSSARRAPSRRQQALNTYTHNISGLINEFNDPNTTPERKSEIASEMSATTAEYQKAKRPQNIYELMGLELNDEEKQAIATSTQYAMDAINSLMQLEQAWADKAVENAQRRVDATRNALQIEQEARANGYANNVEYAQKEYEAAKKQQERALKQRRRLQQAQQAIDAATQITNLVTGTTEIWKVYAAQPWVAASLTALMWSSFAASKVMAMQAVKAQNEKEEYAEGTVELLQGGSHASGNDVDLGVKPNGVRRRAEGGEYFAVINRRNSRKYRRQIPDIINALNRGDFDKRYISAEQASAEMGKYVAAYDKAGNITLKYERSATDLRRLEDDVRKLREQGETRTAIDGRGNVVEYYKNIRRVIRS